MAIQTWSTACTAGGAGACANLAMAYDDGVGVSRDRPRALTMSRDACSRGAIPACVTVATMLTDGRAGPKNTTEGAALMRRSCEASDFYACMNLAYRYLDGSFGERKDAAQAQLLFRRACDVAVLDHPYPWYREATSESCRQSRVTPQS